jgi:CBS domain-containing protein
MRVNEVMTRNPACCGPQDSLETVAKAMVVNDCGSIPVVDDETRKIVGVVTDRDIATRVVAAGRDPSTVKVNEVMSHPVACISDEDPMDSCVKLMEQNMIRRAPVIDQAGRLVGIVSQADIARSSKDQAGEMVCEISKATNVGTIG